MIGKLLKKWLLEPRVKKSSWPQLCGAANAVRERYSKLFAQVTEDASRVTTAGLPSVREVVIALSVANRRIAATLHSLRSGRSFVHAVNSPKGLDEWSFEAIRREYEDSWREIGIASAQPIESPIRVPHPFFGPLNAAEWMAALVYEHEMQTRQLDRLMRTQDYANAQGAKWNT